MPIYPIQPQMISPEALFAEATGQKSSAASAVSAQDGKDFSKMLGEAMTDVNQLLKESDRLSQDLAVGKTENLHEAMIASEKAETSFKLMVQMRNKVIEAYTDIMRMQI